MCVSPLAGPSASKTSCRRRNCTHLLVSALEVTSGCWRSLVWKSTPTTSSTCSASGKIQRPTNTTTPWPMLQAASSTHSTTAWRRRWTGRPQTVGDQPAARQPHHVRRNRCVRHVQVMEDNWQHRDRLGYFRRVGSWPLLPLQLHEMRMHESLHSCCLHFFLSLILLF